MRFYLYAFCICIAGCASLTKFLIPYDRLSGSPSTVEQQYKSAYIENGEILDGPLLFSSVITYDRLGRKEKQFIFDCNGVQMDGYDSFKYDEYGNIKEVIIVKSTETVLRESFEYDENGLETMHTQRNGYITEKLYDDTGKLLQKTSNKIGRPGSALNATIIYQYNDQNQVILADESANDGSWSTKTTYKYDAKQRLIRILLSVNLAIFFRRQMCKTIQLTHYIQPLLFTVR